MYTSNIDRIQSNFTESQPSTYDYLKPNVFRFKIQSLPQVSYTCQAANLPGLTLGVAQQTSPFLDIHRIGDKMVFDDLNLTFIVSEDAKNFRELYNWMVALGFPENWGQLNSFLQKRSTILPNQNKLSGDAEFAATSDATLVIMDSANNPKLNVVFQDVFPVSLSGLDFDLRSPTVEYLTAAVSFKYKTYQIEVL